MPIKLDTVPALAQRSTPPRLWLWFGLLLLCLLLGVGATLLFGDESLRQLPVDFLHFALGLPFLAWCVLGFGRVLLHVGEESAADGWDEAREQDMIRRVRQGRCSQQVLGVSLHTTLQETVGEPTAQLEAIDEEPEAALLSVLTQRLADLASILTQVPDDKPLALLLEVDSKLPEDHWRPAWRKAWLESGIRQSTVAVEGCGLAAVDQWLDQRIGDQALLLVLAVRVAPEQPEGMAIAAVGLLFGNRLTQTTLAPIAYLHRPEQERKSTEADLLYAARQALDWVPLEGSSIKQVWRAGIDAQRTAAMASVLLETTIPVDSAQGVRNLDASLGNPGKAAPWLAIAAATHTIERGAGPQFIFSGGDDAAGLWCSVLIPVSPLSI